jgi:hypothetical protein
MKGFQHEVLFVRRVFTNKDGSIGLLNRVCSDLACDGGQVATICQKRWKVEEFHKSLKSNAGLAFVTNPHGHHPEQPRLHVDLCGVQAGVPEDKAQGQPFCATD